MRSSGFDASAVGLWVLDAAGERLGQLSTLYLDLDTGVVSFAGVAMIRRGRRRIVLVPLADATLRSAAITVTCGRQLARRAPSVRAGQMLPADVEAGLYAHYDMKYVPRERAGRRLAPYL